MKSYSFPLNAQSKSAKKIAASVLLALAVSQAHAIIIVQTQIDSGVAPSVLQPLAGDLLETSVVSVTGENAGALVRNGSVTDVPGASTATFAAQVWGGFGLPLSNLVTTYDFDLSVNTLGYDITAVQVYSAWDTTRSSQDYQLFYALVGDPSTFSALGTQVLATTNLASSVITRTEDTVPGASLISGVSSIRFVHGTDGTALNATPGTGTVYRELDVVGFASVPEPSTSLFGLCGALLLFYRRRA